MSNAWDLMPEARNMTVRRLHEHFEGSRLPCDVLRAPKLKQKYTYYFQNLADREMPAETLRAEPCNEALRLSFSDFLRLARDDAKHSYYLQTPVFARGQGGGPTDSNALVPSEELKRRLDEAMQGKFWRELRDCMHNFDWFRSQLFVGPVGTLGCAHFDQYDNVFLQVRGSKRFLLFEPRMGARCLYPFPVHHPYDQRARVDLEAPDLQLYPRFADLRGRGLEASLGPGDALYLPSHWWHAVEASSVARDGWCVSLNFWFDSVGPRLLAPPTPLGSDLEVELARQIEYLVADAAGPEALGGSGGAAQALRTEAARWSAHSDDGPPADSRLLPVQSYVLWHLARIFGDEAVSSFVDDYLDPARWSSLGRVCF